MKFKTLENTTTKAILEVFNKSFADYFVPFQLSEDQLKSKMKSDRIDLSYSVGCFIDNKLVGFILHGFDILDEKQVLYNGGTGVVPESRGQGITKKMYEFLIPSLKSHQIDHVILEVISHNEQAIKSYNSVGFKKVRTLDCFKGCVSNLKINEQLDIKIETENDWTQFQSFWEVKPTWQFSSKSISLLKDRNITYGAYLENELVGYIIYSPSSHRIQQLAVKASKRKIKIATSLIANVLNSYGPEISMINIDNSETSLSLFLNSLGLELNLTQFEMKLNIRNLR